MNARSVNGGTGPLAASAAHRIECPSCGHRLKYPDEHAGKKAKCQKCSHPFRLPAISPVNRDQGNSAMDRDQATGAESSHGFNTIEEQAAAERPNDPDAAGQEKTQQAAPPASFLKSGEPLPSPTSASCRACGRVLADPQSRQYCECGADWHAKSIGSESVAIQPRRPQIGFGIFAFVSLASFPVIFPLMFLLGAQEGYGLVAYFIVAACPSFLLALAEGRINGRQLEEWAEIIYRFHEGDLPSEPPSARDAAPVDFRPHQWGKRLGWIFALAGLLGMIAFGIWDPVDFFAAIGETVRGHKGRVLLLDFLAIVLGGPLIGFIIGYVYGLHLGAMADCWKWLFGRNGAWRP